MIEPAELQKLLDEATPGPWHWENSRTDAPFDFTVPWDGYGEPSLRTVAERESRVGPLPEFILDADPGYILDNPANAALIAQAPDLARAYIAACEMAEALEIAAGFLPKDNRTFRAERQRIADALAAFRKAQETQQ